MTDLEEVKRRIVAAIRDEELASSACYEIEAYSKRWPFVFLVSGWDVWSRDRRSLRLQVIRWLEDEGTPYDFYQFRTGCGLVGFKDSESAKQFELRWSEQTHGMPDSARDWNPHPLKSTFEPAHAN